MKLLIQRDSISWSLASTASAAGLETVSNARFLLKPGRTAFMWNLQFVNLINKQRFLIGGIVQSVDAELLEKMTCELGNDA